MAIVHIPTVPSHEATEQLLALLHEGGHFIEVIEPSPGEFEYVVETGVEAPVQASLL